MLADFFNNIRRKQTVVVRGSRAMGQNLAAAFTASTMGYLGSALSGLGLTLGSREAPLLQSDQL